MIDLSTLPASQRRLITVGAIALLLGAVVLSVRRFFPPAPKLNASPLEELGRMTAEQTAQLIGGSGTVVVWRGPFKAAQSPGPQITFKSFDKQLGKTRGVRVIAQVTGSVDLADAYQPNPPAPALAGAEFIALLEQHRSANAIVLLGAAPVLEDADYARLPNPRPKVLALCLINRPARQLLDDQVIQVAIMPRPQRLASDKTPATPAEWFDLYYQIVTPEKAP